MNKEQFFKGVSTILDLEIKESEAINKEIEGIIFKKFPDICAGGDNKKQVCTELSVLAGKLAVRRTASLYAMYSLANELEE